MRAAPGGLHLLASHALLPAGGETCKLQAGHPRQPVIELPAFTEDPRCAQGVPPRIGRRIDRYSALAYRAVSELVSPLDLPAAERVGVFLANTRAGWAYADPQFDSMIRNGPRIVHPYFVTAWFPAAGIGEVTIGLGYRGPAKTTTGRLSGFAEALWLARDALERRAVELAIVGAVDSLVSPFVLLDLSHAGTCRATRWDRDWLPTLSIAAELAGRVTDTAAQGCDVEVALGDGYRATVRKPRLTGDEWP